MIAGIPGITIAHELRYAVDVNRASASTNFPALVAYPCFYRETIHGEVIGLWDAATVVSEDGGHGLGQLTPAASGIALPPNWRDPFVNARDAIIHYLAPALKYWSALGYKGETLMKFVWAEYNAGREAVIQGHAEGDLELYTTNRYATGCLAYAHALIDGTSLEAVAS